MTDAVRRLSRNGGSRTERPIGETVRLPPFLERRALVALCMAACAAMPVQAFKLQALGGPADVLPQDRQARGFLLLFTSDVHERMTRLAYEKAGVKLPEDVIAGVRWNDNPPALRLGALFGACNTRELRFDQGLGCWASMMRFDRLAWETLSRREKGIAPLRSHFGDMQFLHAMAARAGEPTAETREKSLRWSEFAYRVASGEIPGHANVYALRDDKSLDSATRAWVSGLFSGPEKRLWSVQDVFLPKGTDLKLVAFGTLLHVVEDSYSAAHVVRDTARTQANGCATYDALAPVVEFHTYVGQDTEKHAVCDDAPDWLETPRDGSPVDVLARIVRAYSDGKPWREVQPILATQVFALSPRATPARPGRCFELKIEEPGAPPAPRPTSIDPACEEATRASTR